MPCDLPQIEVQQLLAEIEATFGDVRRGNGISLHQARALDNYEPAKVAAAARAFDMEERWQEVTDDKLDQFNNTLAFMDAAGFRFYMPRFMVYSLTHSGTSSFAVNAPIYICDIGDNSKYALLSPQQRRTISSFLRFAAAHGDCFDGRVARRALSRHWEKHG